MLTLADVLELPVVRRALPEVMAGDGALDRELRWAHVIEMADPDDLLKGGELVLTTGIGAGDAGGRGQRAWIASVLEQGAAAVAVELGTTWREQLPEPVVGRARRRTCRWWRSGAPVRFVEITEAVHAAVLNSQFELLRRGEEIHRRFTELILHGRGVPEILAELAAAVGNPVVLEDAGHELVYYVSGRASGDDVALAAWTDLHRAEDRGEAPEGALLVDVRLMDSSWGRLMALAVDEPLDDFDRVATERAALAVAIDLLGQQHEEHLRARSRGAFLSDLADGRVEEADARRRAEALGLPGLRRGELLPVAASWRGPRARPRRGAVLDAAVGRAARGAVVDRLRRAARPARRRPARAALARRPQLRRGARRARRRAVPRRARAARGRRRGRGAGDRRARRDVGGGRPGAAARAPLGGRRHGAAAAPLVRRPPPGRDRPAARPARRARARRVRRRAARPAAGRRLRRASARCWRRSRRTWPRAAARRRRRARCTSSASRCTCGCTGSRSCSASRSTTRTRCSGCTSRCARCASAAVSAAYAVSRPADPDPATASSRPRNLATS